VKAGAAAKQTPERTVEQAPVQITFSFCSGFLTNSRLADQSRRLLVIEIVCFLKERGEKNSAHYFCKVKGSPDGIFPLCELLFPGRAA
jgi:hypothetical protein